MLICFVARLAMTISYSLDIHRVVAISTAIPHVNNRGLDLEQHHSKVVKRSTSPLARRESLLIQNSKRSRYVRTIDLSA